MPIKIEIQSTVKTRLDLEKTIIGVFDAVPADHVRGIAKVVVVDHIREKMIPAEQREKLPALYHPRMAGQPAWLELAVGSLLKQDKFLNRWAARLNLKSNVAAVLLSLIGRHYHATLSHGVKKHQYEQAVRKYIEKYFVVWRSSRQNRFQKAVGAVLKPIHPYLDKFGQWLARQYQAQLRNQKGKKK